MANVWDNGPQKQGPLLVMLALADYANDAGECWPSIKSIAEKARMTERGVQRILRELEAEKWIETDHGNGRHGCNKYRINPDPRYTPTESRPDPRSTKTPTLDPETPTLSTPEPSEPSLEPSLEDKARAKKVRLPEGWVPDAESVEYAFSKKLTADEITEIADDFHAYWTDRTDAGGRKSLRGWKQAWRNRVRDQAPRFIRNRGVAFKSGTSGYGQGGGIAGAVARRQFGG